MWSDSKYSCLLSKSIKAQLVLRRSRQTANSCWLRTQANAEIRTSASGRSSARSTTSPRSCSRSPWTRSSVADAPLRSGRAVKVVPARQASSSTSSSGALATQWSLVSSATAVRRELSTASVPLNKRPIRHNPQRLFSLI